MQGRWEPAGPPKPAGAAGNDMAAVWDTVYGSDYYATYILKAKQCARGSCTSKQGTCLEAEICKLEIEKNGKMQTIRRGVAKDRKNNIYRIDHLGCKARKACEQNLAAVCQRPPHR